MAPEDNPLDDIPADAEGYNKWCREQMAHDYNDYLNAKVNTHDDIDNSSSSTVTQAIKDLIQKFQELTDEYKKSPDYVDCFACTYATERKLRELIKETISPSHHPMTLELHGITVHSFLTEDQVKAFAISYGAAGKKVGIIEDF